MTDMIARDLQDMQEHPARTVFTLIVTLLIMLSCAGVCIGSIVMAIGVSL